MSSSALWAHSLTRSVRVILDHVRSGARIANAEGLSSFAVHACVVHGPPRLTEYLVHDRFGFPRRPTWDDLAFVWVDPDVVALDLRSRPLPLDGVRATIGRGGGSWDRSTIPFDENPLVQAINERFAAGLDWEETSYVQRAMRRAARGLPAWNDCQSRGDIERRCQRLDGLYASIAREGYKTQEQLFLEEGADDRSPYVRTLGAFQVPDELRVGIGRDGRIIRVVNGRHRVAMAQLLGIERVPAIVQLRHADWEHSPTKLSGVEPAAELADGVLVDSASKVDAPERAIRRSLTKPRARAR